MEKRSFTRFGPESVDNLLENLSYNGLNSFISSLSLYLNQNKPAYFGRYLEVVKQLEEAINFINFRKSLLLRSPPEVLKPMYCHSNLSDSLRRDQVSGSIVRPLKIIRGYLELLETAGTLVINDNASLGSDDIGPMAPSNLADRYCDLGVEDVSLRSFKLRKPK
jgi:hypothetical protein